MKNLKKELIKIAQSWNANGEYDDTKFEGRYFISDEDFDDLAEKSGCISQVDENPDNTAINQNKFERLFDCKIIFDYECSNQNRQFGDSEIIFND